MKWAFWSSNEGVGSNPTSDTNFLFFLQNYGIVKCTSIISNFIHVFLFPMQYVFIYVMNYLTLWIHWMIFEWMNFEQKILQKWMEFKPKSNDLEIFTKKYVPKKKSVDKQKQASSKFTLLHKSRVSLHRSPMRTEAISSAVFIYLYIFAYRWRHQSNNNYRPYLIFRQTTTGRIERRALAFPFFLATVCSRQTIYDQHQCAAPA